MNIVNAGSTQALMLTITDEVTPTNNPVTGQTATVAIRRVSDGKWYDFVAAAWDTFATYALIEASNKQALTDNGDGTYSYSWNQAAADASAEADYEMVYAVPSGTYQGMAYDRYSFRTEWAVAGDNMGTVTGVSGNVTGSVGSVSGNVGGNVAGSVASVTGAVGSVTSPVTVGTNNDKTDYALSSAGITAVQTGLSTLTAQQVWEYSTRTLSSFGTLVADVATAVWAAATRTITGGTISTVSDKTGYALTADYDAAKAAASSSSLATVDGIVDAIKAKTDNLPASPAAVGSPMTLANDAVNSSSVSATAVTEIQSGLATSVEIAALNDLSSAEAQAAAAAALVAYGTATGADVPSASTVATAVWANGTRTLSSFGTLAADVATAVWASTSRTLSSFGTLVADVWTSATRSLTDKADFTLSSDYDAAKTAASATNLATVDTVVDAIKLKTDNLPASPAATGAAMTLTSAERTAIVTALLGTSVTFPDGNTKTLETIIEEVWAASAGDYELAGTNWEIKWVDGTNAFVFELDDATAPTMRTRI